MNKISDIKNGLIAWDNQHPINPHETTKDEILWEEIKRRVKFFESDAIENIRTLLVHIELLESQLEGYKKVYHSEWIKQRDELQKENESLREELKITKENWRNMANQIADGFTKRYDF